MDGWRMGGGERESSSSRSGSADHDMIDRKFITSDRVIL